MGPPMYVKRELFLQYCTYEIDTCLATLNSSSHQVDYIDSYLSVCHARKMHRLPFILKDEVFSTKMKIHAIFEIPRA